MVLKDILQKLRVSDLQNEIRKVLSSFKGFKNMKKSELIEVMLENESLFKHLDKVDTSKFKKENVPKPKGKIQKQRDKDKPVKEELKKEPTEYVKFVKKYRTENNLSLKDAMKEIKEKALYKAKTPAKPKVKLSKEEQKEREDKLSRIRIKKKLVEYEKTVTNDPATRDKTQFLKLKKIIGKKTPIQKKKRLMLREKIPKMYKKLKELNFFEDLDIEKEESKYSNIIKKKEEKIDPNEETEELLGIKKEKKEKTKQPKKKQKKQKKPLTKEEMKKKINTLEGEKEAIEDRKEEIKNDMKNEKDKKIIKNLDKEFETLFNRDNDINSEIMDLKDKIFELEEEEKLLIKFKINVEKFIKKPTDELFDEILLETDLIDELPTKDKDRLNKALEKFEEGEPEPKKPEPKKPETKKKQVNKNTDEPKKITYEYLENNKKRQTEYVLKVGRMMRKYNFLPVEEKRTSLNKKLKKEIKEHMEFIFNAPKSMREHLSEQFENKQEFPGEFEDDYDDFINPHSTQKPASKPKKPAKEIKGELTDRQKKVLSSVNTYLNDTTRDSSNAEMEFHTTKKLLKMKFTPKFTQEILKLYNEFLENNDENNIQRKNERYLSRILKEKNLLTKKPTPKKPAPKPAPKPEPKKETKKEPKKETTNKLKAIVRKVNQNDSRYVANFKKLSRGEQLKAMMKQIELTGQPLKKEEYQEMADKFYNGIFSILSKSASRAIPEIINNYHLPLSALEILYQGQDKGTKIDFYPTPKKCIDTLINALPLRFKPKSKGDYRNEQTTILEGTAGIGNVAYFINQINPNYAIQANEINKGLYSLMRNFLPSEIETTNDDFFDINQDYDIIFLNPPFGSVSQGTANFFFKFLLHALKILNDNKGGYIMFISPPLIKFKQNSKGQLVFGDYQYSSIADFFKYINPTSGVLPSTMVKFINQLNDTNFSSKTFNKVLQNIEEGSNPDKDDDNQNDLYKIVDEDYRFLYGEVVGVCEDFGGTGVRAQMNLIQVMK